jgi:serine O-acetyltransferase
VFKSNDNSDNAVMRDIRSRHPGLREAVVADLRFAFVHRIEPPPRPGAETLLQILRLCWESDAFLAQVIYRVKTALQRRRVPVLPRICHRLSIIIAGVNIGDPVVMHPGVHLLHGKVVIDGITEIRSGVVIGPFASIGLVSGDFTGPTIEEDVMVGASASVLGRLTVGRGATIGANTSVFRDVPAGARVVPASATVVGGSASPEDELPDYP